MQGGAIRIGSIASIPIRIHVTFLLVLPLLAFGFARVYRDAARMAGIPAERLSGSPFLWGLVVALGLFLSVLVHELAHSLYALRRGGQVRDITLLMIGGVSQITEPPHGARAEAVMALAGPATSLVLGFAFWLLFRGFAGTAFSNLDFTLAQLASLNVVLGIFNLLPAFPMDGGRILRSLLVGRMGLLRATRLAAGAGKLFAVLFGIVGFLTANILLMVIAFFIYLGAEAETRGVLVRAVLGHLRVRDLVVWRPEPIDPATPVYDVAERMLREQRTAYPVVAAGEVLGVVGLDEVQKVPGEERRRTLVADVIRRVAPLQADEEVSRALRHFEEAGVRAVPVVDGGALAGILTQLDVARGLQLGELEASQHPRRAELRTREAV